MVGGGAAAVVEERFLRRMQNQARTPMIARPTIGPTTAPAIQALLEDFSSLVSGVRLGVEALGSLPPLEVVAAGVDRGEDPIHGQHMIFSWTHFYSLDVVFAASGWTR